MFAGYAPQKGTLGHPVSVLLGHAAPVTFLSFCEAAPWALLSVSLDATCRIWDAETSGAAVHVLQPSALFGKSPHPRLVCLEVPQLVPTAAHVPLDHVCPQKSTRRGLGTVLARSLALSLAAQSQAKGAMGQQQLAPRLLSTPFAQHALRPIRALLPQLSRHLKLGLRRH
jgi:hypothetical protein